MPKSHNRLLGRLKALLPLLFVIFLSFFSIHCGPPDIPIGKRTELNYSDDGRTIQMAITVVSLSSVVLQIKVENMGSEVCIINGEQCIQLDKDEKIIGSLKNCYDESLTYSYIQVSPGETKVIFVTLEDGASRIDFKRRDGDELKTKFTIKL